MVPSVQQDMFSTERPAQKKRVAQIRLYGVSASPHKRFPGELAVKKMSKAEYERRFPSAPPPLTPDLTISQSVSSSTPRSISTNLPCSSALSLEPVVTAPRDLSPRSRRQLRYHRAQTALSSSLQHSLPEPSPVDQQIRALERATAMLSTQARESKEQAARLRECLADRANMEPTEYESMLRERWLADKRETDMSNAVRILEASLTALRETSHRPHAPEEAAAGESRMSPRKHAKAKANLALFLEQAGTRVPLASRLAPGQHVVVAAQWRKTMHHVRSLRLRQSACALAFMQHPAPAHTRPLSPAGSLDERSPKFSPASPASPRTPPLPGTPSKGALASSRSPKTPPRYSSRLVPHPQSPSDSPSSPWTAGFADILLPDSPRSRADLLSQVEADDPGVPAYAVDLLDALVASELDVSLRAPAHGPMPHTPPRARHESDSFGTAAARMIADNPLPASPHRRSSPAPASPGRDRSTSASSMPGWMNAAIPRARGSSSKSGASATAKPSASSAQKIRQSLHLGGLSVSKSNPNMKATAHAHAHAQLGNHSRLGSGSPLRGVLVPTSSSLSSVPESLASRSSESEEGAEDGRTGRAESRAAENMMDGDLAESRSFSVVSFSVKGEEPQGVGGLVARVRNRLSGLGNRR